MKSLFQAIILISMVSGCSTYAADRYAVSMDTHAELERNFGDADGLRIAVNDFGATEPGRSVIDCRAVGPIKTPDNQTFEAFVQRALIDQLLLADLYAPDAPIKIGGNLDEINFSSTEGEWTLALTISDSRGRSFAVREEYDYDTSFYGETACNQTAQALMPAVQNLIRKVVSNPTFDSMINGGA